jgi:hypothetical protein
MRKLRLLPLILPLVFAIGFVGCDDDDDVTGADQSLVSLRVDAPDQARSGESFDTTVRTRNAGFSGVSNGRVEITLPAPLTVASVDAEAGTNATFTNGASGARVVWDLGTLDSNTESDVTIRASGTLGAADPATQRLTIAASMTAEGINAGEVVAQDDVTLVK